MSDHWRTSSGMPSVLPYRTTEDRCPKWREGSRLAARRFIASWKDWGSRTPERLSHADHGGPASAFAMQNSPAKFQKCPFFGQIPTEVWIRTDGGLALTSR